MKTLPTVPLFEQLRAKARPLMTAYFEDLTEIDRKAIAEKPGVPFLHWTREWGTGLQFLLPADDASWPAKGEVVPYLFGRADREHILTQNREVAAYYLTMGQTRIAHYFDGRTLREITTQDAVMIAAEHGRKVRDEWAKPERYWTTERALASAAA